jgi:hypothetical protein
MLLLYDEAMKTPIRLQDKTIEVTTKRTLKQAQFSTHCAARLELGVYVRLIKPFEPDQRPEMISSQSVSRMCY